MKRPNVYSYSTCSSTVIVHAAKLCTRETFNYYTLGFVGKAESHRNREHYNYLLVLPSVDPPAKPDVCLLTTTY